MKNVLVMTPLSGSLPSATTRLTLSVPCIDRSVRKQSHQPSLFVRHNREGEVRYPKNVSSRILSRISMMLDSSVSEERITSALIIVKRDWLSDIIQ